MRSNLWIGMTLCASAMLVLAGCIGCESAPGPPAKPGGATGGVVVPSGSNTEAKVEGEVELDGSSTVFVVSQAVAEEFDAAQPGVAISVKSSGTGGGFKRFVTGELDIAGASRPIKQEEIEKAQAAGVEFIELPICFDALTVAVPKSNDWVDSIKVEELKAIWEAAAEEKLTMWNQVPGHESWPAQKLALYGAGADSGTFEYFTEAICKEKGNHRKDYGGNENDNVIVQNIEGNKVALGYIPLAYYEANKDKLKALSIDAGQGPVAPSSATVKDGSYHPLARPLFIYVNRKAAERPAVKAFVEFYIDNAGKLAEEVHYVPFNADKYPIIKKRYAELKTGTEFEGKAAVGKTEDDIVKP